jgi:hypothetical protein
MLNAWPFMHRGNAAYNPATHGSVAGRPAGGLHGATSGTQPNCRQRRDAESHPEPIGKPVAQPQPVAVTDPFAVAQPIAFTDPEP